MASRSVQDVLAELAKRERAAGLLSAKKPGMGGLLAGAIPIDEAPSGLSAIEASLVSGNAARRVPSNSPATIVAEIEDRFDATPGMSEKPRGGGLLATGQKPSGGGLLAVGPTSDSVRGPAPARASARRSPIAQAGNFIDDFFLDGALGERSEARRQRDEARAASAAHREAFAYASGPQGFDPARYQQRMAELGQAPDMPGLVNLEGINDGRDVRGFRNRQEQRGVTAGALASTMGLPEDQRPAALESVAQYLQGQGYGFDPNTSAAGVNAAVGAGMGADIWLDNARGDRSQFEQERATREAENFRKSDLGFRQGESQWERGYRERRAEAEDFYRSQELDYRREALTVPNSTGDVLAPILAKVATVGVEGLNEGERMIWERYQQSGQNPFATLMGGMPGADPAAPVARPQAADPFPGIPEGQTVEQDGKRYVRRGNQMIEVR